MRALRERLTYRLAALVVVLGFTVLWVLGRDIQVGDNTFHPDAIAALLVAAGAVIWYMFPQLSSWADKPIPVLGKAKVNSQPAEKDPIKANRKALLEAVDQTWLSGLLDHLLNQQEALKIGLEALEPDKLAKRMGGEPYPLTDNQAALKTFEDFGRRLVLLGEPGAGKTVLMLQLARSLWNAAKNDERKRIPMVFPLASWAAKQLPFNEWLQAEMQNRYSASANLAKALVESEQVIFLLDGLDEVAEAHREDCLKALKTFVEDKDRHVEYVLCSRRTEFGTLQTRLDVPGEIVLQPLTSKQIQDYLKPESLAALRKLVESNNIVRNEFATVPFMLNTMAYVTRGKSDDGLRRMLVDKDTMESLRATFLEVYVTQRLDEKTNENYSNTKTRHWLRWLAGQLIKHDETDFYLENMQPDWLKDERQEERWRLGVRLVVGLGVGLVSGLGVGLVSGLGVGLVAGLGFGLGVELRKTINMNDQLRWTISRANLVFGLVFGLGVGLVSGLGVGLVSGLVAGLVFGLVAGLVFGLVAGLVFGLDAQSLLRYRVLPGQGIWRSLWNGLFITLVFGLVGGLMGGLSFGLSFGLVGGLTLGLVFGLVAGLNYGLKAFIQHYILRWMLARKGDLPYWRYDHFLDYGHELVILRKVGGGYRFVHDMLRQHLAATMTE